MENLFSAFRGTESGREYPSCIAVSYVISIPNNQYARVAHWGALNPINTQSCFGGAGGSLHPHLSLFTVAHRVFPIAGAGPRVESWSKRKTSCLTVFPGMC